MLCSTSYRVSVSHVILHSVRTACCERPREPWRIWRRGTPNRAGLNSILHWVVTACLGLCSANCTREAPALRVGINAWPGYEALYLAQQKGFYRELGVAVRLVEFSALADARRAYERGQIDVLAASAIEVIQIRDQGVRSPQIVQVVDYSNGADVILGRASITHAELLRGARIGVELGSLGAYVLARALEKHGLGFSDAKALSMDQLSMEAELGAGHLDAVVTYPPTSIKLQAAAGIHTLFSTREIPAEVVDIIAVEESLLRERPADVVKLLRAFQRAVAYMHAYPKRAYAIMAAREGISPSDFERAISDGIQLVPGDEQAGFFGPSGKLKRVIEVCSRVLVQTGQIKRGIEPAAVIAASQIAAGTLP